MHSDSNTQETAAQLSAPLVTQSSADDSQEAPQSYPQQQAQRHPQPPSQEPQPQPAAQTAPPLVTQSTADCQKAPQGYPQSPPQGYPQQQPQGYPQQQPQGHPQQQPQGHPQQQPQGHPQQQPRSLPQQQPQGYPQQQPQGYPQSPPQCHPQQSQGYSQSPYGQQQPQPVYGVPSYQPQPGVVYVQPPLQATSYPGTIPNMAAKPIRTVGKFYWSTEEWTAPDTPQEWTSGLVDCLSNYGNCFDVTICMPRVVAHQMAASEGMRNHSTCGNCAMATLLFCFLPVFSCVIRKRVVKRYNIDDCLEGVGFGLCLFPCSLCQTHRELTARGMWPGGSCCESRSAGVPTTTYYPATHPRFQIVMN